MGTSKHIDRNSIRLLVYGGLVAGSFILDRLTKLWAMASLASGTPEPFIPGVMNLLLVENTGAAFSIGAGHTWFFVIFALAFVGAATYFSLCSKDLNLGSIVCLALVAGGALGNCYDRMFQGFVSDFLSLIPISFPVFNVADIFVTMGILLFFVFLDR